MPLVSGSVQVQKTEAVPESRPWLHCLYVATLSWAVLKRAWRWTCVLFCGRQSLNTMWNVTCGFVSETSYHDDTSGRTASG